MPGTPTTRHSLATIAGGSDNVSTWPTVYNAVAASLDSSVYVSSGTLAARSGVTPAVGDEYYATDVGLSYKWNGSAWLTVATLASPYGPLQFRAVTSAATAANGQNVFAAGTGPYTVTLPTPIASGIVQVGSGQVTNALITIASGGPSIYGIGLPGGGASSFPLGTNASSVLLQSDGTSWVIIAGQQDTGWVSLTAGSAGPYGVFTTGSETPACRLIGDRVYLQGAVTCSGAVGSGAAISVVLPSSTFYPSATKYVGAGITVSAGGNLASSNALAAGQIVPLTGASYVR